MNCLTKICGITREEDIRVCLQAGIDAVGFLVRLNPSWRQYPETISIKKIASLIELAKSEGEILTTLLIHSKSISEIKKLISEAKPDAIQVQPRSELEMGDLLSIKDSFPSLKVIRTFGVNFEPGIMKVENHVDDLINEIDSLYRSKAIDFVNLDTVVNGGGGQGKTHNWNDSKIIVGSVDAPCILAGGLDAKNVEEALSVVRPYGVDVMSGVGQIMNGKRSKALKSAKEIYNFKVNCNLV